jgi:ABC-2 type transport system permease protein/lipopolysaccharide transport system permease protein
VAERPSPAHVHDAIAERGRTPPPDEPAKELLFRRRIGALTAARELWQYRELVVTLAERDLRVRYKQAVLGIAWALVTPLLLMGAFALIFTRFTNVGTHGVPYALFAAIGLVPWSFFSTGFARGGTSLVTLASVVLAIADAIAASLVLAVLFPLTGYAPRLESLYAPLLLVIALFFTIGVTLVVSAVVVYLRDLQVLLPLIVQFGLFVTPVAYSSQSVVRNSTGQIIYAALNPLAPVIDGLRRGILFGQAPRLTPTVAAAISSVVVLVAGFVAFKRMEAGLADIA